jgi:predicted DCC family thiol-disulfide oxidoreductase YuxK
MTRDQLIILFDGECPFCVGWIKFLIDRDADDRFRFASLQSDWTTRFLIRHEIVESLPDSIVVWDGDRFLTRSAALIAIAEALPGIWHGMRHLDMFPKEFRDRIYAAIARNRHRLFGKYETCWVPKPDVRGKFLDSGEASRQDSSNGDTTKDPAHPHTG